MHPKHQLGSDNSQKKKKKKKITEAEEVPREFTNSTVPKKQVSGVFSIFILSRSQAILGMKCKSVNYLILLFLHGKDDCKAVPQMHMYLNGIYLILHI